MCAFMQQRKNQFKKYKIEDVRTITVKRDFGTILSNHALCSIRNSGVLVY